jgi:hypothetical protein
MELLGGILRQAKPDPSTHRIAKERGVCDVQMIQDRDNGGTRVTLLIPNPLS